jgi:nucleolar protein 6
LIFFDLTINSGGGGGNSKDRKAKIQDKNQKLNEERARRIQEEEKAKATKIGTSVDENSIHPSRRTRVQGA